MYVVIPHVGKSHLTRECLQSIPDEHRVVLVDASYVADLDVYARHRSTTVEYVRPDEPLGCLAANWNIGATHVPDTEAVWLFCASDVQFYAESWMRLSKMIHLYPDSGIIRDSGTNWNVWAIRRWAWDLLKPMDERYKPCGGEDDDLVMKCHHAGIKIRAGRIGVNHLEGGHATRIDIACEETKTTWDARRATHALFRSKWGCVPSLRRDETYRAAHRAVHITEKRTEPPKGWDGHSIPTHREPWPDRVWPDPLLINVGCGIKPRPGHVNIDANPGCRRADLILDASREPWPFRGDTADEVCAYHSLEHMDRKGGEHCLSEALRVLKPGGRIVIECPDLLGVCAKFPKSQRRMMLAIYGDQANSWRRHLWGYARATIRVALDVAGFIDVEVGDGTDYHAPQGPCFRAEARKAGK